MAEYNRKGKRVSVICAVAGVLLGLMAWRAVHFNPQETVALSYDYRPGSEGFPESDVTTSWNAPVTWLLDGKNYRLAGLPTGRYLFKTSLALPADWDLDDSPVTVLTPGGDVGLSCEEQQRFPSGDFKKVKCRDTIGWKDAGDASIKGYMPEGVGLLSLRITNYTVYDKKLGFVVFRQTVPDTRRNLSPFWGILVTIVLALGFGLWGAKAKRRVVGAAISIGPVFLVVMEGLLLLFTYSRIILTWPGLIVFGMLPGALVWLAAELSTEPGAFVKKLSGFGAKLKCEEPSRIKGHLIAIVLIFVVSLCVFSMSATTDPGHYWCDEPIYATVVKAMVETNNYWTPYEGGSPFFHKPPLGLFWPTVPIAETFGVTPVVVRFVPWLYALGLAILCYLIGYRFAGHFAGVASAGVLLSTQLFQLHSTAAMFETPLAFWQVLTALLICRLQPLSVRRGIVVGAALGVTVMIKGAACAPLFVWLAFYLFLYKRTDWLEWKPALGVLGAFVFVGLPWHLYHYWRFNGLFWNEYWGYHVWARYSEGIEQPERGWTYYFGCLNRYARPWYWLYPLAALVVWKWRPKKYNLMPLILFGAVVFVLYTSAKTKIDQYLYPMLPVFSIAVGCAVMRFCPKRYACLVYLLPVIGVFVAESAEEIKTRQRRRAENVEVIQYIDAHWAEKVPVLSSNVYRTEIGKLIGNREYRVAAVEDLSGLSPLVPHAPFLIRSEDNAEWKEPLEKAGFSQVFKNVFAHIYAVSDESRFKPIPMDIEPEPAFVDIAWHDGLQVLLALKNDGTIWLCEETRVSSICGTVPDVNPLFPAVKIIAAGQDELIVFHQTGELSVMKGVKEEANLQFVMQERRSPWSKFRASANFKGLDCDLDLNDLSKSALLTSDGRVRIGREQPTGVPRYASLGQPIYLARSPQAKDRWLVVYSQGGIGGFPAGEPVMEPILRQYRGPIGWGPPRLTDARMLSDGQIVVLDVLGTLRAMGPGSHRRIESVWVPQARNAFCVMERGDEKDFLIIDAKGAIETHVVKRW